MLLLDILTAAGQVFLLTLGSAAACGGVGQFLFGGIGFTPGCLQPYCSFGQTRLFGGIFCCQLFGFTGQAGKGFFRIIE